MRRFSIFFVITALAAPPVWAQDSADDIRAKLLAQQELYKQAEEAGGQGAPRSLSRGLSIVTFEEAGIEPPEIAETEDVAVAAPELDGDFVYADFEPSLEINLQIIFGFDSAALDPAEKPKLGAMCEALADSPVELVRIIGHTDTSGSNAYNDRLSLLRAQEVARHLVTECGIAATRLEAVGLGERFPSNEADGRADENRRVEFQALG